MLECSVSTSERCCEEVNLTERSYCHNILPGNLSLYAIRHISKLRMVNLNAEGLTIVDSYL